MLVIKTSQFVISPSYEMSAGGKDTKFEGLSTTPYTQFFLTL